MRLAGGGLTHRGSAAHVLSSDLLYYCAYELDRGAGQTPAWAIYAGSSRPATQTLVQAERAVKAGGYYTVRRVGHLGAGAFIGKTVDELSCDAWFRGRSGRTTWVSVEAQLGVSQARMCAVAQNVALLFRPS